MMNLSQIELLKKQRYVEWKESHFPMNNGAASVEDRQWLIEWRFAEWKEDLLYRRFCLSKLNLTEQEAYLTATLDGRRQLIEKEWSEDRFAECTRGDVERAIKEEAMIRVRSILDAAGPGFEIVLRPKTEQGVVIYLYCHLDRGGLFTSDGTTIFYPYEFSMQKYQGSRDVRAATEYVRRKFATMGGV